MRQDSHEKCADCVESFYVCDGWPHDKAFACANFIQLRDASKRPEMRPDIAMSLGKSQAVWTRFPGAKDNVDSDLAIRDMASSFGVKTEHTRSVRQRDELRRQRAAALQAQQQVESQQAIAKCAG